MSFDNRIWKLDLNNLWFNNNRRNILDSLIKLDSKTRFRAHLTGSKGAGKSTLITSLANKTQNVKIFRMMGDTEVDFAILNLEYSYLVIDEAQKLSEEERQGIMMSHPRVLMVSVVDLTDDGYSFIYRIEDLTIEEVKSYINKYDSNGFDEGAKEEIAKASSGRPRLINLLCRTCLEISEKVDKNIVEQVAKKKYKLRY